MILFELSSWTSFSIHHTNKLSQKLQQDKIRLKYMFWEILHLFSHRNFCSHKDTRKTMLAKDNGNQEQDDEEKESSKALKEKAMETKKKAKP